jgi:spermidine synthase
MSQRARRAKQRGAAGADSRAQPRALPAGPAAGLLFVSGAAALVYETLWVRQIGRVVGVEVHAVSIALSAFFAGLALGNAGLGRLVDRVPRPVRLYAQLEAGAAVLGVLSTLALARSAGPFVALHDAVGPLAWALPFGLVGLPAILMGGTLPALLRSLHPGAEDVAPATGVLYAANTAGAVLGTLASPFLLVPAFGIQGAAFFAAALGLAAAGAALVVDRRAPSGNAVTTAPPDIAAPDVLRDARFALILYAAAGGVALGYEVVWSELLVQFLSTRAFAFAVMLATYLSGLALGSFLFARLGGSAPDPWRTLGVLLAAAGTSALGIAALVGPWLPDAQTFAGMWAMRVTGRETVEVAARFMVAAAVVLLLPTTLLGAAFPAAARLVARADRVGRDVGTTLALNTTGGIAGTLVTGFVLVPWLGLVRTLAALAVAGALLGALAVLRGGRGRTGAWVGATAMVLAAAVLGVAIPRDKLAALLAEKRGGRLVFYSEDTGGTVAVLEQGKAEASFRRLYIQGVSNSGDALTSLRYMRLQALLPLLIHKGEPRSALVVGFGTGITAGALLTDPALQTRVVAELLPPVVRGGAFFTGNLGAPTDPRLEIRIGDGRQELLRRSERYDLVTLEPPPPSAAGVANLYSTDFYELVRTRLKPDGLMAQWWPLPAQNDEDSRSLVKSFLDVFPFATAWSTELHEVLLIGSQSPIEIDGARVAARYAEPPLRTVLAEVGIESPEALLATWVTDRVGLERFAADAPPVTDDRPLIEHAAWVRRGELERVLPRLMALATDVPLPPSDPRRPAVEAERRELLGFYRFSLHAMSGARAEAGAALQGVLEHDPRNPYYLWVAYGVRPALR